MMKKLIAAIINRIGNPGEYINVVHVIAII